MHRVEREREAGERRPQAVVQVAADSATLLFAQLDEAAAGGLQLVGEADGMNGRRHLGCEVGDQAAVGLTQLLTRPRREPELSDGQTLMHAAESGVGPALGTAVRHGDFVARRRV